MFETVHAPADRHPLDLGLDRSLDLYLAGHSHQVGRQVVNDGVRATIRVPPRPRVQVVAQLLDARLKRCSQFLRGAVRVLLGQRVNERSQAGRRIRGPIGADGREEPAQRAGERPLELRR